MASLLPSGNMPGELRGLYFSPCPGTKMISIYNWSYDHIIIYDNWSYDHMIISVFTKCFLRSILPCGRQKKLLLWSKMPSGCEALKLLIVIGFKFLIKSVMTFTTLREAILQKIPEFYEILIKRWPPPPPYCFYEILILILPLILGYLLFLNKRYEIQLTPPPRLWNYFIKFRYFLK